MKRGRWILAIVVGIAIAAAGGYVFVRAARLDDQGAWKAHRAMVASEGLQTGDSGSFGVTWTDDDGKRHEDHIETSPDEARAMVENLGGTEIDVRVFRREKDWIVCPTVGFDTCVEHRKDLKGGYIAIGAALLLILYALFRLVFAKRPGAL